MSVVPITSGIVIHWVEASNEYIELDLNDLTKLNEVRETREWGFYCKKWVLYNTRSKIKRLSGGALELTLTYDKRDNTKIGRDYSLWGKSTISLVPGAASGLVSWHDADCPEKNNRQVRWKRIHSGPLTGPIKPIVTSKLQRDQTAFRCALLTHETCCALTGETTPIALQAAHIIPCKHGGREVIENGMLLRADIHLLYDDGKFSIDPFGKVVHVRKDLAESYKTLLRNARVPRKTYERTKIALRHSLAQGHR